MLLRTAILGLIVVVLASVGCNGPTVTLPKTYPVSGTVVHKGGAPLKGGSLLFVSADDPLLRIIGPIDDQGKFVLRTVKDTAHAEGVPEGEYQVTVMLPLVKDPQSGLDFAHQGVPPVILPTPYKIAAGANVLKIELPDATPAH